MTAENNHSSRKATVAGDAVSVVRDLRRQLKLLEKDLQFERGLNYQMIGYMSKSFFEGMKLIATCHALMLENSVLKLEQRDLYGISG